MRTFAIICVVLTCMVCFAEEPRGYYSAPIIEGSSMMRLPTHVDEADVQRLIASSARNDLLLRIQPAQLLMRAGASAPSGWYWRFESEGFMPQFGDKNLYVMPTAKLVGIATEAVQDLGKSGRLCEVYGHNWRTGRPGETVVESANGMISYMSMYADYHPNTNYRTCRICGVCQVQELGWK